MMKSIFVVIFGITLAFFTACAVMYTVASSAFNAEVYGGLFGYMSGLSNVEMYLSFGAAAIPMFVIIGGTFWLLDEIK